MPRAGALRTRLEGLLARTHAPAEPPGQARQVERAGMHNLNEGQKISYEVVADQRTGKFSAGNLRAV